MFISLCLSLHACLLCLRGWCLCILCVFVCLSLLFLVRSHQSLARWELSLSTYCLLIPLSLFPTCDTQNTPLVNLSKQTLSPSIPRCLGYDLDSLPFSSLPFKKKTLSQYWDIQMKRQYWERHLIAFRRQTHSC